MAGNVKRFRSNKGYESINRNMLQDEDNLSLEAIGLLSNLLSYPDNWELYKTELHKRFKKAGRTKINRAWDELVAEGYIIQFRKRVGRKYDYSFYFQDERFSAEDIEELKEFEGVNIWDGKAKIDKNKDTNKENNKNNQTEENESEKDGDGVEGRQINVSSTVRNQQSKSDSPKRADKKLRTKEVYHKKEEEEYIIKAKNENISLQILSDLLQEKGLSKQTSNNIVSEAIKYEFYDFSLLDAMKQIEYMTNEYNNGIVYGQYHVYFINGLISRTEQRRISDIDKLNKEIAEQHKKKKDTSVYFNWLKTV